MENLPASDQASVSSPSVAKQLKNSKWLFIVLGVVILVLISEGIYWLKLSKEKKPFTGETSEQTETGAFLSKEEQLRADIIRVFWDDEDESVQVDVRDILSALEIASKIDPEESFDKRLSQYTYYTAVAGKVKAFYYASGDAPEKRNQEMLAVLSKIRELARKNPSYSEEDWEVMGVDSY